MSGVTTKRPPAFITRLKTALIDGLRAVGIPASVDAEPIPTTKLYRVGVLAPKFKRLKPSERQDLVWRIAERSLSVDEQMRISMILTLAPDESVDG